MGRPERSDALYGTASGVAGSVGSWEIAPPGYILDGLALVEGEVHGVDEVSEWGEACSDAG